MKISSILSLVLLLCLGSKLLVGCGTDPNLVCAAAPEEHAHAFETRYYTERLPAAESYEQLASEPERASFVQEAPTPTYAVTSALEEEQVREEQEIREREVEQEKLEQEQIAAQEMQAAREEQALRARTAEEEAEREAAERAHTFTPKVQQHTLNIR